MQDDEKEALKAQLEAARRGTSLKTLVAVKRKELEMQLRLDAADDRLFEVYRARVAAQQALAAEVVKTAQARGEASAAQAALVKAHEEHTQQIVSLVGASPKTKNSFLLSECFAAFEREHVAKRAWNEKTLDYQRGMFRLLIEGIGDRPIADVKRNDMTVFFERLQRLPANAQKKSGLKGKTFVELTDMTGYPTISAQTINDRMGAVSSFFKWAMRVEEYGLTRNPAEGFGMRGVGDAVVRQPFTEAQLVALFTHESWQRREFLHPHYFWLMPVAALTGMRLNEICQLRLVDFKQVGGIDVIECADLDEGTRRKNPNATRKVPIHHELVQLGLLRWVEKMRAVGQAQLFPELKPGRDGHGQAASKWFGRYREACGIIGEQTHVFHSFRHLFISSRLDHGVQPHQIAAVVGHETGLITGDVYWNARDAERLLRDVVEVVGLPGKVLELIPTIEEVTFKPSERRPPSRLGARKSREQRIADAARRRSTSTGKAGGAGKQRNAV